MKGTNANEDILNKRVNVYFLLLMPIKVQFCVVIEAANLSNLPDFNFCTIKTC